MNSFKSLRIEYHILQSFPVTCLNRDDVGAPKSVIIGGTSRARVSSQCWKRQVRLTLHDLGIKIGIRTKHLKELFFSALESKGANEEQAQACSEVMAAALAKDTLYFISTNEVNQLAEYAKTQSFEAIKVADGTGKGTDKKFFAEAKKHLKSNEDGLDIALFGRMVASAPELNVEAACSFAHAVSTHKVSNEIDFFTAVDEKETGTGAGHMGSLEYNSATYYRYISLDLGQLAETFRGEDMSKAIEAFTKAIYLALPSARQTTQTGLCPWEYAKVFVRKGQGIQASFDQAVKANNGYLEPSIKALEEWLKTKELQAGTLFGKQAEYTFGKDSSLSIDELATALAQFSKNN